jgi:hypothetical protein
VNADPGPPAVEEPGRGASWAKVLLASGCSVVLALAAAVALVAWISRR